MFDDTLRFFANHLEAPDSADWASIASSNIAELLLSASMEQGAAEMEQAAMSHKPCSAMRKKQEK